jgi:hypothetical protein
MARGLDIECGCFSQEGSLVGLDILVRDIVWLAMSVLIVRREDKMLELFPKSG